MLLRRGVVAVLTLLTVALSGTACGSTAEPAGAPPSVAPSEGRQVQSAVSGDASRIAKPPVRPSVGGSGQAQAEAFVQKQPGTFGLIVKDRTTGAVWKAGNTTATTWTASTSSASSRRDSKRFATSLAARHDSSQIKLIWPIETSSRIIIGSVETTETNEFDTVAAERR